MDSAKARWRQVARLLVAMLIVPALVVATGCGGGDDDGGSGSSEVESTREADIVVLAVPLSDETRGMVDDAFLGHMKEGALLVNVARGPVVDTDALLEHLRRGRVRAALDVTEPEPLPSDHPLWSAPNVTITPHVGGDTDAMGPHVERLVRRQIELLSTGQDPTNIIFVS